MKRKRWILLGVGVCAVLVFGVFGWQGIRAWSAWNSIDRVPFDLAEARENLPPTTAPAGASPSSTTTLTPDPVAYQTVLVIGSDEREPRDPGEAFADTVLLYVLPDDGSGPAVVSVPRDSRVVDPCTGIVTTLARTLVACGEGVSSSEHVALAMEELAGIEMTHFALVDFGAFESVIDVVGGVELCSRYPLREGGLELLPEGCSTVDGAHALAWLRSRATQAFIDGEWRFVDELGDEARVARHPVLLFALLDRLKAIRSPGRLAGIAEDLGDGIALSDTLGIGDAVSLAWDLRSRAASEIRTATLPTEPDPLENGSYAVRPTMSVRELLEGSG